MLAKLIGEDGSMYEAESGKIYAAMQNNLWLKDNGWFAEYKDLLGLKQVHSSAALWTVYHAIDEGTASPQQQYQLLRYVDNYIPHIPVKLNGLKDEDYYLLSTTNWQPYTWSINNVALGEVMHTALAYWQGGESDNAFKLWKSMLVESMYGSASPGGFEQLSYYDAARGELYRDFADGIGVTARTLTEGLFGILPDALNDRLLIKPGFPSSWKFAKLTVPDISVDFKEQGNNTLYNISQSYSKILNVTLQLKAAKDKVLAVTVNGKPAKWHWLENAVGQPAVVIEAGSAKNIAVKITWSGNAIEHIQAQPVYTAGEKLDIDLVKAKCIATDDPQQIFSSIKNAGTGISCISSGKNSFASFFVTLKQGDATWTEPVSIDARKIYALVPFIPSAKAVFTTVDMQPYFNDKVTQIFKNKYMSPRPQSTTLQLPWQGIGNWCYPLSDANINDSGLRVKAGVENKIYLGQIPFATPAAMDAKNIIYTSLWDNYPASSTVPLSGKAQHAYLLMAGSTNHMQSHFVNAVVKVKYKDGTESRLPLVNPQNWYPIEQDYMDDGFAFTTGAPKPYRLLLKTGEFVKDISKFTGIKGLTNRAIDGGAATVIEMPLNKDKELQSLTVETRANEVVVGLMSVTLVSGE